MSRRSKQQLAAPTKAQRLEKATAQHIKALARLGVTYNNKRTRLRGITSQQEAPVVLRRAAPTSDNIPSGGFKRDIFLDHKWRRGAEEKPETIAAIQHKATQVQPSFNKGPLQYVPDSEAKGRAEARINGVHK